MKITSIQPQKNNSEKFNIFIDEEYKFSLTANTIIQYKLTKNMEISEELLKELEEIDSKEKAYIYLIDYLQYGYHTEKEFRTKLRMKKYSEQAISYAIEKAKKYNYINDDEYCKRYVETYLNASNVYGPNKIIQKLLQKGIPLDKIKLEIEAQEQEESIQDKIRALANKKINTIRESNPYKRKQKLFNFLVGKGFDFDDINMVINEILDDKND